MTLIAISLMGCVYTEGLPEIDVQGTVRIPVEAATRSDGTPDARLIGPVWLGAFPNIADAGLLFDYPHPEMGPVYLDGTPGNTYPYGGGSVGRYDFACFSSIACKVLTGRFSDYDDILDYFSNVAEIPITDEFGVEVASTDYFRSYCYELFEYTADYEMEWISGESGLDFTLSDDSQYFEADFDLWMVQHYESMKIWGWMDAPSEKFSFTTCNDSSGNQSSGYATDFYYGTNHSGLLNFPSQYIFDGDWVATSGFEITTTSAKEYRESPPDILVTLDFPVEE